MKFIEFLIKEYHLGEESAKQYQHRLNGLIERGIYKGQTSFPRDLFANLEREYKPNSIKNYKLTIERYIAFKQRESEY
ncbi:hypothetical protein ACE198_04980 [Neobacillus sp. KR4-4]|uniref:hypothetical protein n=1 Tax=Neobacillus sp. KR4-4 TaxID=3344872 RepID=UPI0035CC126F